MGVGVWRFIKKMLWSTICPASVVLVTVVTSLTRGFPQTPVKTSLRQISAAGHLVGGDTFMQGWVGKATILSTSVCQPVGQPVTWNRTPELLHPLIGLFKH